MGIFSSPTKSPLTRPMHTNGYPSLCDQSEGGANTLTPHKDGQRRAME